MAVLLGALPERKVPVRAYVGFRVALAVELELEGQGDLGEGVVRLREARQQLALPGEVGPLVLGTCWIRGIGPGVTLVIGSAPED